MTRLANPSWRIPTRPCPFYSQGKCLFSDACNFVHDVKITATPIKSADTILLPKISCTSPLSEHHPEPVIVTSNPFLEDEAPLDRLQAIVESPEVFQEAEHVESLKASSPIQLPENRNRRVHHHLGLPDAPLYLNELKSYQRKHHLLPSPNSTVQELSCSDGNDCGMDMSLQPIAESSLLQLRRAAQKKALDDLHILSQDKAENSSSLGLLNMEYAAEAPAQSEPLTSTPRKDPRGLRPLRLPALRSASLSLVTPVQASAQPSLNHEFLARELFGQDPPASLIPSPIGPFGLDDSKNMEFFQTHTMTLSELNGGHNDDTLKEPNTDFDVSMFSDDTVDNGPDTPGNTSIFDDIYGPNEPLEHLPHELTAETAPSLSSSRRLSLSTTESEFTAVIGNKKRFSNIGDSDLRGPLELTPVVASNSPDQRVPLPGDGDGLANPIPSSRPASRASKCDTPISPSTESIPWSGRATPISSSDDMYRRPPTTSPRERTKQMQSIASILDAIDEVHERSSTPPLRLNRPSSRATSTRVPTTINRAPSIASITSPTLSGNPLPDHTPTALGRGSGRRLTIQTTLRDNPSPIGSCTPSTAASAMSSAPHLFFALASDSPVQVSNVLSSGQATPNDRAGPEDLPALVFSLTNDQLRNKTEIVKTLLSHGADPSVVQHLVPPRTDGAHSDSSHSEDVEDSPLAQKLRGSMNPAIEYYLGRQNAATQKQVEALQEGHYDPLLRARFHIVGQDLVLDEMMRAVASHSRRKGGVTSLALVLTGPSGHGKSHLASKIGILLQSPLYIVNMTNLRTQEDLMRAQTLAHESDDSRDLLSFLETYESKRCVVVLEEIEKTAEKQVLHSLLMPWELGKLPASPANPVIDTSEVIWVCTSNSGEELAFEFSHHNGTNKPSSREQYKKLMSRMRARLADELGAPIVSRVQGVLPFLPFTYDEQRVLASEMLDRLISRSDHSTEAANASLTPAVAHEIVDLAIQDYIEREGARSIHRAVHELYEEKLIDM